MADYISREAALELIDNAPIIAGNENETLISAPKLSDEVYCIPAADVRPVVRGKWERPKGSTPRSWIFRCSVCGERAYFPVPKYFPKGCGYNFCPTCGADMRPDKNDQSKEAG